MLKQLMIAVLLLAGSDLCLGDETPHDKQTITSSLKSIVILPTKLQANLQAVQLAFGSEGEADRTSAFGDNRNEGDDASFDWGFVGNGVGFNKRF